MAVAYDVLVLTLLMVLGRLCLCCGLNCAVWWEGVVQTCDLITWLHTTMGGLSTVWWYCRTWWNGGHGVVNGWCRQLCEVEEFLDVPLILLKVPYLQ